MVTKEQIQEHLLAGVVTARQAEILTMRLRFSQQTVATGLGISRSTVRSLERTALDKIART